MSYSAGGRADRRQVHRDILLKSEWFRTALCGRFKEATEQAIDLPDEDPAIFHFLVAFLYENRYKPIRPASSALGKTISTHIVLHPSIA